MRTAILFALIGLALSLAYSSQYGWHSDYERQIDYYSGLATNGLVSCQVYTYSFTTSDCQPTAYRFPVYPLFLGVAERLFGGEPGARVFQSVLASLLVFLVCALTARNGGLPALAGLLMLLNFLLYTYAVWLETELLFAFALIVLLICVLRRRVILSGLLFGVALLTRAAVLFSAPLVLLFIPVRKWPILIASTLMALIPWWVRNVVELHTFIPLSTSSGLVLYGANNTSMYRDGPDRLPVAYWGGFATLPTWNAINANRSEVARDQQETGLALEFVAQQPAMLLIRVAIARIVNWFGRADGTSVVAALFPLALIFAAVYRKRIDTRLIALCLVFIIGAIINAVVFYGSARFRFPVEPEISIVVGLLLVPGVKV